MVDAAATDGNGRGDDEEKDAREGMILRTGSRSKLTRREEEAAAGEGGRGLGRLMVVVGRPRRCGANVRGVGAWRLG